MEQRPGAQPSGTTQEPVEGQPEGVVPSVTGHRRVLVIREFWKQEETYATLKNFTDQSPKDEATGSASTQATNCQSSPSNSVVGLGRKRAGDSLADSPEPPAPKSKCSAKPPQQVDLKTARPAHRKAPRAPRGSPCADVARVEGLGSEPGTQLLLVLCHASALSTQLPRLQLLLQQVRLQDRRPPAALVGILVQPQPRPEDDAEARRRLENLLCSIYASERPSVEVHTAVFCPGRPQGVLDVQRAAGQAHMPPLVDRQTQTDAHLTITGFPGVYPTRDIQWPRALITTTCPQGSPTNRNPHLFSMPDIFKSKFSIQESSAGDLCGPTLLLLCCLS